MWFWIRYHAICDNSETGDGMLSFTRGQLVFVRYAPEEGLWEGFTDNDNKVGPSLQSRTLYSHAIN